MGPAQGHLISVLTHSLTIRYFVESDELRARREGTFLRGALVEVLAGHPCPYPYPSP